jgi:hypothetical protein
MSLILLAPQNRSRQNQEKLRKCQSASFGICALFATGVLFFRIVLMQLLSKGVEAGCRQSQEDRHSCLSFLPDRNVWPPVFFNFAVLLGAEVRDFGQPRGCASEGSAALIA